MKRGMTMIEIMVVMGVFVVLASIALHFTIHSFQGSSVHSDRDEFVALLQRARAQSISNVCNGSACTDGVAHGVAIIGSQYVLFQGESYATRDADQDAVFEATELVARSGSSEVVFTQLSGTTTGAQFVHVSSLYVSTTTVESNGRIWWTQ
jgi:prepilin-type N-terminal cleavage/methylation domain-containing protein